MRPSIILFTTLVAFSVATPSPEPCSDHPGVVHEVAALVASAKSSSAHHKTSKMTPKRKGKANKSKATSGQKQVSTTAFPWAQASIKPKALPAVQKASTVTMNDGAAAAIKQFSGSSYIPESVAQKLTDALHAAVAKQMAAHNSASVKLTTVRKTQTITKVSVASATPKSQATLASAHVKAAGASHSSAPAVVTVHDVETRVVTVTQTATAPAGSNAAGAAALDIQKALADAFAAVNLSEAGLNNTTVSALEACLSTVLKSGGLPSGYSCLTSTGSNSAGLQTTLNTILEQFSGILPNKILSIMFSAILPSLTALLPANESALVAEIQASMKSVIATLTGSSVTALEQASTCYTQAIQANGNTSALACYTSSGAAATLKDASNAVIANFVGVLPPALITQVQHIIDYNLAGSNKTSADVLAGQVQAQISNAIISTGATLSGNLVSTAETLQGCATLLISTGNGTAAQECITNGKAPTFSMVSIFGLAEQYQGYLPSSFFSDLVAYSTPFLANATTNPHGLSQAQLNAEFEKYFNNATSYGPAFVGCIEQVGTCVTKAITDTGKIDAVCPGPIAGCEMMQRSSRVKRHLDGRRWTRSWEKYAA